MLAYIDPAVLAWQALADIREELPFARMREVRDELARRIEVVRDHLPRPVQVVG